MKKINVITLGCSKNTVDSEHLMARLAAAGYEVLFDSDRTDAKVVVINTCGFIGDAKQACDFLKGLERDIYPDFRPEK